MILSGRVLGLPCYLPSLPYPNPITSCLLGVAAFTFSAVLPYYSHGFPCPAFQNLPPPPACSFPSLSRGLRRTELRPRRRRPRRRAAVQLLSAGFLAAVSPPPPSLAARRGRIVVPPEDYVTAPDGLKYYDLIEGKGPTAKKGSIVQVHFDCIYRGITAVSSRESKLLAGNRSIAQPYEFIVGSLPGKERKRDFADNANGLYSAQAAPKPPAAMYTITEGMKVGERYAEGQLAQLKRRVIVPPELGYGKRGMSEIPPDASFELDIELLEVIPAAEK